MGGPDFQIRASPLLAFLVGADSGKDRTPGRFGYVFARYFDSMGSIQEQTFNSLIWVHVVRSAARSMQALQSVVAFSFPLCDCPTRKWNMERAIRMVKNQVLEFSQYLGSTVVTDMLMTFWPLAKYIVTPATELDEELHLIIHLMTEARLPPTYVYAHVDEAGGPWVEAAANYCWILCRTALGDQWAPPIEGELTRTTPRPSYPRR